MKTNHYSDYAQERIAFYSERFRSYSIIELVDAFNHETASKGWVSEKAYYLEALVAAIESHGVSTNCILQTESNGKRSLSLKEPVRYDQTDHSLKIIN